VSKYDWESGTLTIPTKAWKPLRDGLAKSFNERQAQLLSIAIALHALIAEWKKTAPRGTFSVTSAIDALRTSGRHSSLFRQFDDDREGVDWEIRRSLSGKTEKNDIDNKKLRTPKKQDFPLAVPTKHTHYSVGGGEGGITLDHEKRELTWTVYENNRAVERARESFMGRKLFELLGKVEWTRGSGGEFAGNDEYNRDNQDAGGGANYVTQRFGPLSKEEKEQRARASRLGYGGGRSYGFGSRY
jgi:hypothetical protein